MMRIRSSFVSLTRYVHTMSQAFPMLKFFHQGKLYDYRGPRDAEHLMEFARVRKALHAVMFTESDIFAFFCHCHTSPLLRSVLFHAPLT